MIPNFNFLGREYSAYMICALIGIFVSGIFSLKQIDKKDETEYLTILSWSAIGVLFGSHLLFGLTNIEKIIDLISNHKKIVLQDLNIIFGGSVFYGGLLGGLAAAFLYCKIKKINAKKYLDATAMFIPLFHVFGRIGCFLSGCCFGAESKIGFIYKYSPVEFANNVRRFPIQLAEAFCNLLIFLIILYLFKRNILKDRLLTLYLILYPTCRFFLEFFRGDTYRGFLLGFSTSQIISVLLLVIAVPILIFSQKKNGSVIEDHKSN